jgi:hypothetical protein
MMRLLKDYYIHGIEFDKEYLYSLHLTSLDIDIYFSWIVVPLFFIFLWRGLQGRLKANGFLTGLMFYPIVSYYTQTLYGLTSFDHLSDIVFLMAFSLSFAAIVFSVVSLYECTETIYTKRRFQKGIAVAYLICVIVLLLGYITLRLVTETRLPHIYGGYENDVLFLIFMLAILIFYFTRAALRNEKGAYIALPILVTALTVSVISQGYIGLDIVILRELKPTYRFSFSHLDTAVALSFTLVSILYLIYVSSRFIEDQ